jgi:5-methylcytosine-specific restriction endonuclease McrA
MHQRKCWICRAIADTGEHKIKKSLLKNLYSVEFQEQKMLFYKNKKFRKLQGANSSLIKYSNTLCRHCNNTFTQPYDIAFDTFIKYIQKNRKTISKFRYIDFQDVYKDNFDDKLTDLYKYFTKNTRL